MVSPIRLMIADDEEIARKALRLLLQKEMPEIELLPDASNGIEVVAMAQELKPDIAITSGLLISSVFFSFSSTPSMSAHKNVGEHNIR